MDTYPTHFSADPDAAAHRLDEALINSDLNIYEHRRLANIDIAVLAEALDNAVHGGVSAIDDNLVLRTAGMIADGYRPGYRHQPDPQPEATGWAFARLHAVP